MSTSGTGHREGSLEAPTRHPIDWQNPEFYDHDRLFSELERVFDICHGCRRCVSLCQAFPSLFDLVDESSTMEVDGVDKQDYWKVVDQCYLCDLCYMTKCPYVPPHEWNVDFPHLMLRAKAVKFKQGQTKRRDKLITSTDAMGKLMAIPVVAQTVNAANRNSMARAMLQSLLGIHAEALLPRYSAKQYRSMFEVVKPEASPQATRLTQGRVALFTTCYGNYNEPDLAADLVSVYRHNGIEVTLLEQEQCCGMPKLELGDLDSVGKLKAFNIPRMQAMIDQGWDIVAPIPSCVLMFKQELPLMYPQDPVVQQVKSRVFDPFEYLILRNKEEKLNLNFKQGLGKVAYQAACHQRVQNIGQKTKEVFELIPDTHVEVIERCSGHDGTYAVKKESHALSMKIGQPVVKRVKQAQADYYTSDCAMAAKHIQNGMADGSEAVFPFRLLRQAYGI